MNLVFVTIDAWRADFTGSYAGVPLVPALERVKDRTVRFDNVYANGPWTSPALVSVFTGQPPRAHGVHYEWSSPRAGPGLVERLQERGIETPNLCYLNRLDNYSGLGYEQFEGPRPPRGPDDSTLLDALGSTAQPFFLWFHYKYVHLPYWPAERYRALFDVGDVSPRLRDSVCQEFVVAREEHDLSGVTADEVETTRRLYAAGVRQMSDWLEGILDALPPDTCLVLSSDHGEELFDHGFVGHASTAHHAHLHEEVLRIPLLVVHPKATAARHDVRLQGTDLHEMLYGLAMGERPRPPVVEPDRVFPFLSARMGCPTPRELAGQFVEGWADCRHKLVCERYETPRRFAFDLVADPEEKAPIEDPEFLDALEARFSRARR